MTKKTVRTADELVRVTTEDGKSIEATPEHPFWVEGKGFVPARRLARSDLLPDAEGHEHAVVSLEWKRGRFEVYNFEVEHSHTYFAGGWLVHNGCGGVVPNEIGKAGEEAAEIVKNSEQIESFNRIRNYRVPDILDHDAKVIGDVKNTRYVYLSRQLRDYLAYAEQNGYQMVLRYKPGARFSQQLRAAVDAGRIFATPIGTP